MTAILTVEQLQKIMPRAPGARISLCFVPLAAALAEFEISTPKRIAAFLAQLAHESGEFEFCEEIWGPTKQQKRYEPPSDLARKLGNVEKGDGYRFRGRGPIQITGRANYKTFGDLLKLDLVNDPDLAAKPEHGFRIAGAFWSRKGLNTLADAGCFRAITKRINGGVNGYEARCEYWERAKTVLGVASLSV